MSVSTSPNQVRFSLVLLAAILRLRRTVIWTLVFYACAAMAVVILATRVVARGGVGFYEEPNIFVYFRIIVLACPVFAGIFAGVSTMTQEFEQGTFRFSFTQGAGPRRWMLANMLVVYVATLIGLVLLSVATRYFIHRDSVVRTSPDWSIASTFTNPFFIISLGVLLLSVSMLIGLVAKRTIPSFVLAISCIAAFYSLCYLWLYQQSLHLAAVTTRAPYLANPPRRSFMISALVHDHSGNLFAPIWSPSQFVRLAHSRHFSFWLEYVPGSLHNEFIIWWSVSLTIMTVTSAISASLQMRRK